MKKTFFISLVFFSLLSFAQGEEMKIGWEENKKLTWEDFQGDPDHKNTYHANTSSGISFSWSLKTSEDSREFIYKVQTSFYPLKSWVKEKRGGNGLLAHEQLHFDISELFARKLRQQLSLYTLGPDVKQDLNNIYQQNEKARQRMQELYDLETEHGLKFDAQAEWEKFVEGELSGLSKFSE